MEHMLGGRRYSRHGGHRGERGPSQPCSQGASAVLSRETKPACNGQGQVGWLITNRASDLLEVWIATGHRAFLWDPRHLEQWSLLCMRAGASVFAKGESPLFSTVSRALLSVGASRASPSHHQHQKNGVHSSGERHPWRPPGFWF